MGISSPLRPVDLRCDRRPEPFGIGSLQPTLSWKFAGLTDPTPDARQEAYQIIAATTPEKLTSAAADLWDSGRIRSNETLNVTYTGGSVASGERIWWTVRVWDHAGGVSDFALATWWERALLADDWIPARWIAPDYAMWSTGHGGQYPAPLLRRTFLLPTAPVRARAYVCGLGYHEFHINGTVCGNAVLEPAQTDYDRHGLYVTHDVTALLHVGENALGFILGHGWFHQDQVWKGGFTPYGRPGAIAKIVINCADDTQHEVVTDHAWLCAPSPIIFNSVYAGESYDARLESPGWNKSGQPGGHWQPVSIVPPLTPLLLPQQLPPIRRTQQIPAVSQRAITKGTWVYDLGQNFAGWVRLRVNAPRGTEVCLRFAEDVFADGSLNPLSTGVVHTGFVQTDRYICRGDGLETWEPRFTYHGFRYVEVTGLDGEPPLDLVEGVVIHTDFAPAGHFSCSDPLLNRLHDTARWTLRSNLHGVPTDCPARERCGWLGDAHTITEVTLLNFDSLTFWRKYHRDILNSLGRGDPTEPRVPTNVAPGQRHCGQARPDWAVALVLIPWHLHVYTDDRSLLREAYPAMREFSNWLEEIAENHLVHDGYGDWCPPGLLEPVECPAALTSSAFYFLTITVMARCAEALGESSDAKRYIRMAESIQMAFQQRFYREPEHTYGSQTANAIALAFGLVPRSETAHVASALSRNITVEHGGHFNAGIHGLRHLFDMLCEHGQTSAAWTALQTDGWPGFKQHYAFGATTFWEVFYHPWKHTMHDRSLNHPMQAAFAAWFFHGIGGIRPDPATPGFKHFTLRPHLWRELTWAQATYDSARGLIASRWQRDENHFKWRITVPANTTATVTIPCSNPSSLRLNGRITDVLPAESAFARIVLPPGNHVLVSVFIG